MLHSIRPVRHAGIVLAALVAAALAAALAPGAAFCGPASPDGMTLTQPDGSRFTAFVRGDEFQGWIETGEGYTVVRDRRTNSWHYAEKAKDGTLRPSPMRVMPGKGPPPEVQKRLKPPRDTKREKSFSESVIRRGPPDGKGRPPGKANSAGPESGPAAAGGATSPVRTTFAADPSGYWYPYPVSGSRELLIVLVNFSDRTLVTTPDDWYASVFDNASGVRSVANFYTDNSFGTLSVNPASHSQPGSPQGVVVADVSSPHPDYGNNITYAAETAWMNEALADVSSFVNFSSFDTSGDGVFQNEELVVYFVLAGYEASGSSKHPNVWAHAWGGSGVSAGGVGLEHWAMNGELNNSDVRHTMGVIAHELGHSMCGLPDLYDTSYTNKGMGGYSLMASGSWGRSSSDTYSGATPVSLDAWSRRHVGWSAPREYGAGCDVGFPPALSAPDAPLMMNNTSVSTTEFFLAENRYPEGWDLGMERWLGADWGGGILVQHIDITVGTSSNDGTTGNNDINRYVSGGHQGVMVVEANTDFGTLVGDTSYGHVTHLFYEENNPNFADSTIPDTRLYDGSATGLGIFGVSVRGYAMDAHYAVPGSDILSPSGGAYLFTNTTTTVTGTASDGCGVGLQLVEVSWDDGQSWHSADDTSGNSSWTSWSYDWTPDADGFYDVIARAKDTQGRYQSTFTPVSVAVGPPDSTGPTGSVTIAAGDASVPTQDVVLTVSATDDGLGVEAMRLSGDGTFDTEPWEDLVAYRTWTLPNSTGINTVYAMFRDWAGNISGPVTDSVDVVPDYTVPDTIWSRTDGSMGDDYAESVAFDGTSTIYTAGSTFGNIGWNLNQGYRDIVLSKFNLRGNRLWSKQVGTEDYDRGFSVVADPSGNAYVAGYSASSLDGNTYYGWQDMVLLKYSDTGELLWSRQLGTSGVEVAYAVALSPSGDVYVAGTSDGAFDGHIGTGDYDYFIVKYDSSGNKGWSVLDGTTGYDTVRSLAVDGSGNLYVSGYSYGLGGSYHTPAPSDIFVAKYSPAGALTWSKTFDSLDSERSYGVDVSGAGDIYVSGYTDGALGDGTPDGGDDAVLMKLGTDGSVVWTWQLGTVSDELATDVKVDQAGNVYVAGYTYGDLGGTNAGLGDLVAIKYDQNGTRLWTRQTGLGGDDVFTGLVPVGDGVCLTGYSYVSSADGGNDSYEFITVMLGELPAHCENSVQDPGEDGVDCGGECIPCDQEQPESDITYPFNGTYVGGPNVTVTGTAVDTGGSGLAYVQFSTDNGITWDNASGTDPWSYAWTSIPDGTYPLACRAVDNAGNIGLIRDGIEVTVGPQDDTPPDGSVVIEGGAGYTIYDTVRLDLPATDPISGVTHMRVSNDGVFDTEPWDNYTTPVTWRLEGARGQKTVFAMFRDWAGNVSGAVSDDIFYSSSSDNFGILWSALDGSSSDDIAHDIAVDGVGASYVAGETNGVLDGGSGYGGTDMYLAKYDTDGTRLWIRQLGGAGNDKAMHIALDGLGNVYVTGEAMNGFDGKPNEGGTIDVFVVKYDSDGVKLWSDLAGSSANEYAGGVSTDASGNVYVTGSTYGSMNGAAVVGGGDYFVVKYSPSGTVQWTAEGGSTGYEGVLAMAADGAGNTYITGYTTGGLDGYVNQGTSDFFLIKLDTYGSEVFARQVGSTGGDYGYDIVIGTDDDVYISGSSSGSFDGNPSNLGSDIILVKYGPDGAKLWSEQVGGIHNEVGYGVAPSPGGGVLVTGWSSSLLDGDVDPVAEDIFVMKFDAGGRRLWTKQFGTNATDIAYDAGTDSFGNLYITGETAGGLNGETPLGLKDGFVVKLGVSQSVPELTHYNYNTYTSGGDCASCHTPAQTFTSGQVPGTERSFCTSCHNPAGLAHDTPSRTPAMHSGFASVTSSPYVTPVYGNITTGEYDNRPYANLAADVTVTCATCHNIMQKTEDIGRVWELTTTSDNLTYTLQYGPWSDYDYVTPVVYRDASLWSGPFYSEDRKSYLVDPAEYAYDEAAGTVTFLQAQDPGAYIYVTLSYPSLRANNSANRLCTDCHAEQTHMSENCLTCHAPHGSANLAGIRESVRTTDGSERTVVFMNRSGSGSFADGDPTYDGVCEVCHTLTDYHRRDGSGFINHSGGFDRTGTDCTVCHTHGTGFAR